MRFICYEGVNMFRKVNLLLKVILALLVAAISVAGGLSVSTALVNSDVSSQMVVTSTNNDVTADVEPLGLMGEESK